MTAFEVFNLFLALTVVIYGLKYKKLICIFLFSDICCFFVVFVILHSSVRKGLIGANGPVLINVISYIYKAGHH